jgi:uncharacterized RDD family membrane protein YckC
MVAVVLDFFIVLFLSYAVQDYIFEALRLTITDHRSTIIAVSLLYFAASWVSPMRATPAQFLLGMRVIDEAGERLSVGRAVLRGVLLIGLILAAVTSNRQAVHDLLAHSLVVNKTALKSPERREQLRQHVTDSDPVSRKQRRPSVLSIVGNMIVLGIPMFVLLNFALVHYDRNLRSRVAYAVREVAPLTLAVEEYYAYYTRWPTKESELGPATRADYPDGGYYELEDDGVIRIRFTVKPELMKGSIVVRPTVEEDGVTWECHADADISRGHLPAACR